MCYDTVRLRLCKLELKPDQNFDIARSILSNSQDHIPNNGKPSYYTGEYKNLRVTINQTHMYIQGSLSKYLKGHNFSNFTLEETKKAIKRLSKEFNLPLELADITRLDIAHNIEVSQLPINYFPHLISMPNRNREDKWEKKGTLYFKNGTKGLMFYDKKKCSKDKKSDIPLEFRGKNILRIETKINKNVALNLKLDRLQAFQLYDVDFFNKILTYWKNEYLSVLKLNGMSSYLGKGKPMQIQFGIEAHKIGPENLISKYMYRCKTAVEKSRLKNLVYKCYKLVMDNNTSLLIEELNKLVEKAYNRALERIQEN